VNIQAAVKILY